MKYLRSYEEKLYYKDSYWLIPTDDRAFDALNKLGCNNFEYVKYAIDPKSSGTNYDDNNRNYMYISYDHQDQTWSWMPYSKISKQFYKGNDYKYMGSINMIEEEISQNKYNL
jgi:hypothetical protein